MNIKRNNRDKSKKSSWHAAGVIGALFLCMIWLLHTDMLLRLPSFSPPPTIDSAPANSEKSEPPPMYHSLAYNTDPIRRTTCAKEILYPATEELFNIAKYSDFTDGELPRNMFDAEAQRMFTAKVTQHYCDENNRSEDDPVCKKLAVNIRKFDIPPDIHAMSGGGIGYVTGGLYNSDMVLEAVRLAGGEQALKRITNSVGSTVLDWGGSSGRSISIMKAAFPLIDAHLADPIRKSIQWANVNIPNVTGYASPINPPTRYESKQFDLIFAISIWSHYNFGPGEKTTNGDSRGSAIRWLDEMRRIIKPNGFLVITTHGYGAVYSKVTTPQLSNSIMKAFEDGTGEFYDAAFPDNIDWDADTKNPDWGMSWVDPNWLAEKTSGSWKIDVLRNARSDCLQDVLVMRPIGNK